jgi:hypothetical protein
VDNDTGGTLTVEVDGQAQGEVGPYDILVADLAAGRHQVRFREGSRETGRAEVSLNAGKVTVLNPAGTASYSLGTHAYSPATRFVDGGPQYADAQGRDPIEVDFGLLDAVPEVIEVRSLPRLLGGKPHGLETRTKLTKRVDAEELDVRQAMGIARHPTAYVTGAVPRAFAALGSAPPAPEVRALLVALADSADAALAGQALQALRPYATELPVADVGRWLKSGKAPLVNAAARLACRQEAGVALLHAEFPLLPAEDQRLVLRSLTTDLEDAQKPPQPLRRFLLASALQHWPPTASAELAATASAEDLELDDDYVHAVDTYVASLTDPARQREWNSLWLRKLCRAAPALSNDWIVRRLVDLLAGPRPDTQFDVTGEALAALLARGDVAPLVERYATLPESLRQRALHQVAREAQAGPQVPEARLPLLAAGLTDTMPALRALAFSTLSRQASDRQGVLPALAAALRRETDRPTREAMESDLVSRLGGGIRDLPPERQRQTALSAPAPGLVAKAMDALLFNPARDANLSALARELPAAPTPENRAWFLDELDRFERFRESPAFTREYDGLVLRGLADEAESVRAAAMRARVATLDLFAKQPPEAAAALGPAAGSPRRQELTREFYRALADRYAGVCRNDGYESSYRKLAEQRVLALAGAEDPRTALNALAGLKDVYALDAIGRLAAVFQAGSPEVRARVVTVVGVNNDEAWPTARPLFEAGLADADARVRAAAFAAVKRWCSSAARAPTVLVAVKGAAADATEPALQQEMADWIKRFSQRAKP